MFLETSAMESTLVYEKCKRSARLLVIKQFFSNLLGTQYFFEILHASLIVKNSEYMVKSECFEKTLRWKAPIFFKMKEGYQTSCVKILMF